MPEKIDDSKQNRRVQRFATALGGGIVIVVGIIAIPYPGPGWLIVFAGLGILAREFHWAKRLLHYGRTKYDAWNVWVLRQHWSVKTVTFTLTAIVVIVTVWLVNGYGFINDILNLHLDWLKSPLIK